MGWRAVGRALGVLDAVAYRERSRDGPDVRGAARTPTSEELELELVELGLSGRCFQPPEYAEALGRKLGVKIVFSFVDPLADPAALRRFASDGRLAEARHLVRAHAVLIDLPANLSPFLLALTTLHELAHVAAGDVVAGKRIALRAPPEYENAREQQADVRARYLYLAGSLGPENPYALRLHGVP